MVESIVSVQPVADVPYQVSAPPIKKRAEGYPSIPDSLGASARGSEDYLMSKPVLTPPSRRIEGVNTGIRLIDAMDFFHQLCDEFLSIVTVRIEAFNGELDDLLKQVKAAAEKAKESMFWGMLQKVATSILAALSIVLGVSLLTNGASALVGGAMIFSGIATISNMVMSEAGGWDWLAEKMADNAEEQKRLATLFPVVVGLIAGVVGCLGSISAVTYFGTGMTTMMTVMAVTQSTVSVLNGGITIGKGFSDARATCYRAKLVKFKALVTEKNQCLDILTKNIEHLLEVLDNDRNRNQSMMRAIVETNHVVVQRA